MQFSRDIPRHKDQNEDRHIPPVEEPAESQPRFAIKNSEQNEKGERINQAEQTFGEARQGATNPKAEKPEIAPPPSLITIHAAKNCAGDESAENRLRHDDAAEDRRSETAKINQAAKKSAPVVAQFFADQECQRC